MVGFDASVKAIIKHRVANRAVTTKNNLSTDYDDVANELENYTRLRLGIPLPGAISFFQRSRSNQRQSAEVAAAESNWTRKITRIGTGVATLRDWLGSDGKPVSTELSEARASVCETCPQNTKGDWLSLFTKPVSNIILAQIAERNRMKLATSKDAALGLCEACGCPLKLKVHVPLSFIKSHMQPTESSNLDPRCWILKEP